MQLQELPLSLPPTSLPFHPTFLSLPSNTLDNSQTLPLAGLEWGYDAPICPSPKREGAALPPSSPPRLLPTPGGDALTQDGQGSVGLVLYFLWTSLGLIEEAGGGNIP